MSPLCVHTLFPILVRWQVSLPVCWWPEYDYEATVCHFLWVHEQLQMSGAKPHPLSHWPQVHLWYQALSAERGGGYLRSKTKHCRTIDTTSGWKEDLNGKGGDRSVRKSLLISKGESPHAAEMHPVVQATMENSTSALLMRNLFPGLNGSFQVLLYTTGCWFCKWWSP